MNVLTVDYHAPDAPELFCKSLKETGFAVLKNHPIPPDIIDKAYEQWREFFASGEKSKYIPEKMKQDGYFPFRAEHAKDSNAADLKEFFQFYPAGRKPLETEEVSFKIYQAMNEMAETLLQWVEEHLPDKIAEKLSMPLKDMAKNCATTMLRILHYPPLTNDIEPGAVRGAAHEDINLITLLPAATAPGLEVKDIHGDWHSVECDSGSIVVNVGDMLQECTQYYYKSTTHRVINPVDENQFRSRYSMPLFLHARCDVRLSDKYTAKEYLDERLREIGIY
ncbi:MAG TPA: 2OG-Fe(II) oxygenase family protein [Gammaproteobacteria bacterium]|jgi:isopenicillin N synthase-like dioxygenase|nr:2OG-Fe(II) oxygenase family protein [Gammaproteobacteria bacterium]